MAVSLSSRIARLLPALLIVASCESGDRPTTPRFGPEFAISDAVHSGGNPHFFFLPPMVPAPSYSGTTDPTQSPVVIVCDWVTRGSSSACGTIVAFFSMSAGTGSEVVRYGPSSQAYSVNWHTDQCLTGACTLDPTKTYRLRVLVGPLELGNADVIVVSNGAQLKNIQTGQVIGLVDGRTLAVQFRIEQGAVAVVAPGSPTAIGTSGGNIVTSDGHVALAVPAGALAAPTNLTVATATSFPTGTGAWSAPVDLGPTGTTFATPVTLTLSFDPTQLPLGVPPSALSVYVSDGTGWQLVPGSTVNSVDNTVSVPISHFSTYTLMIAPTVINGVPNPTTISVAQTTTLSGFVFSYQVMASTYCYYVYGGPFSPPRLVCVTYTNTYSYPVPNQAVLWTALPTGTQVISLASNRTYTDQAGATTSPLIRGVSAGIAQVVASVFVTSGFSLVQSNPVTITVVPPMPTARASFAAAAVNGVLYAVGGSRQPGGIFFNTNEAFDPGANTWTTKTPMPTARETAGQNGAVVNGLVYVIGGTQPGFCTNVNEAYNPATDSWASLAPMPEARCHLAVAALNGLIYAIGGTVTSGAFTFTTVAVYNPADNSWAEGSVAPIPIGRIDAAAAVSNGILYVVGGGASGAQVSSLEAYDPASNTWSEKAPMPTARSGLRVAIINGLLYAVGGFNSSSGYLATVEAYDPAADTWTTKAPVPTARTGLGVAGINGILYAVGGVNNSGYLTTVEAYQP